MQLAYKVLPQRVPPTITMECCLPAEPWTETGTEFKVRLKSVANYINQAFDVAGLTREWPERVEAVAVANVGRIKK